MLRNSGLKGNITKKSPKQPKISDVVIEKDVSIPSTSNVSVITRTTSPKVVIQSEKMNDCNYTCLCSHSGKRQVLKFVCSIVMCIIVLLTFFLSIRIYSMVSKLVLQQ